MTGTFDPVINHMSENEDKGLILRENEVKVLVAQSCQTLCDPQDGSSSGFSVHGISQQESMEWVAIPDRGIKPGPPAFHSDFLSSESSGKPSS